MNDLTEAQYDRITHLLNYLHLDLFAEPIRKVVRWLFHRKLHHVRDAEGVTAYFNRYVRLSLRDQEMIDFYTGGDGHEGEFANQGPLESDYVDLGVGDVLDILASAIVDRSAELLARPQFTIKP